MNFQNIMLNIIIDFLQHRVAVDFLDFKKKKQEVYVYDEYFSWISINSKRTLILNCLIRIILDVYQDRDKYFRGFLYRPLFKLIENYRGFVFIKSEFFVVFSSIFIKHDAFLGIFSWINGNKFS